MIHNKNVTICNQMATQNVINGSHNTLQLKDSRGVVITIAGNNNRIIVLNTSVKLTIFGSNNSLETHNSNVNLSVNGNLNTVICKNSNLEVSNNSGVNNRIENVADRIIVDEGRRDLSESDVSLVGRSNSEASVS